MATDYNIQRNKLYTVLLSTKTIKGNYFLDKKYSFSDFYKRFFSSGQGVNDLYKALTTTKKKSGDFFLNPEKYTLANFYYSFGCDLSFAPNEYCKAQESKFSGYYVDRKAKLRITDISGNLSYVLELDKNYTIPVINKKIDPKIEGKLTNKVGDLYVDKKTWGEVRFNFIDDGAGNITKINVEVVAKAMTKEFSLASYNFTKKNSNEPQPQDNSSDDEFDWREVAKDVWDELKKAGKRVGEEAGKLYAWITKSELEAYTSKKWECVSNYLKANHYRPLTEPFGNQAQKFRTLDWDNVLDNKETSLKLNADNTFEIIYRDGSYKVVPNFFGTWGCGSNNDSFYLKFNNGKTKWYGQSLPGDEFSSDTSNSNVETFPSFSESCPAVKVCPSVDDVEKKGRAFKLCMKCDEIKKLQNTPQFKLIYFNRLKGNGKPEVIDGVFGPIMKAAVEDYQITNGIKKTGMIGPITYKSMINDKEPEQTPATKTPEQPKVTQPKTLNVGEVEIEVATEKTKF